MNTKLNEMNQRFEKNEMAEKEHMQAWRKYGFKVDAWDEMVDALDTKDQEKEEELEKELEELMNLEISVKLEAQRIKKEKRDLQEYFESIPGPKYGDYDLKNAYLIMEEKIEKGDMMDAERESYFSANKGHYVLKPDQYFDNRTHHLFRMISYLFLKGFKELNIFRYYGKNLYYEKVCKEKIYPNLTEKDWNNISQLLFECDSFSVIGDIKYKNEVVLIYISDKGELVVMSESKIVFNFNEILEHMDEVSYENLDWL